jgi:ABC-type phosphate transport system substrate-binding protein
MQRGARWAVFLLLISLAVNCSAKQLAVIVEKGNTTTALSSVDLSKILKAQTRSWPDGSSIKVVIPDPGSPDMQIAMERLYQISSQDLKMLVASHRSSFVVATSAEDLLHIVGSTRGAIGLVDVYSITHDVKVLKIDDKLPLEAGYLLRGK